MSGSSPSQNSLQPNRLAKAGLVDRSKPLSFQFDDRTYGGYHGDTLASALLAADVKHVGRSFKYHRPRGILTAGSEEPNALVELRSGVRVEPNTRATVAELYDGLDAKSQNRWPSLAFDIGAVNSLFSPLFVAGFYYKTFMWPAAFWEKLYEPIIRRAAGLGRASKFPDPDSYEKAHAFCDVLIIGGGPAGLAAALVAGRAGARVILCDEDFRLGGRLNSDQREIASQPGTEWVRQTEAELMSLPGVRLMPRTTVFGVYDGKTYGAIQRVSDHLEAPPAHQPRQRLWKIVAKHTILATGAIERPLVFANNDRPGIMMASAARTYANRFGVTPGQDVTLFTTSDDGWTSATQLAAAGITVRAIVDARDEIAPLLATRAKRIGAQLFTGAKIVDTKGGRALRNISVRDNKGHKTSLQADTLLMAGGWNPNLGLTTHLGGRPRWSDELAAFTPSDDLPAGMIVAGAAQGSFSLADAFRQGVTAAGSVVQALGLKVPLTPTRRTDDDMIAAKPLWHVAESIGKAFVDFQHDVTRDDIALAAREGFRSAELAKRYTTLGMATDQGRTSNVNGHAIMAALTERTIPEVGSTVARPPYTPVALGAFAGHSRGKDFRPTRLTASHQWATERGASFVDAGQWLRAQWFAQPGEMDWLKTVSREVKAVRSSVGVCDVSTLGKIDIQGADAGALLDRIYINTFSSLAVGKARYGVMLREDGLVMDDGTSARLAPDHYIMSTTTVNAGKVMQHLEHARQVLWPELDVQTVSITEQWAQYAIAGPKSRALLAKLLGDAIDISNEAFPYLACAEFKWRDLPARLFRISFSGELAYELAVPARYGDATIRAIMSEGSELGVVPYGTEALGVMRIEKGHVAGNELNGTTTPADLGLGRMMSQKKDFIGSVLVKRPGLIDPLRPSLVGVKPIDHRQRLRAGAHFVAQGAAPSLENDQGYITSVAFSPMLDHWVGLGLLVNGPARRGEVLRAHDPLRGDDIDLEVCAPTFFDRKEPDCMAELHPRSPFTGLFETHPSIEDDGVTVLDRDGLGLATIQCRKGQRSPLEAKVQAEFGVALPSTPRRVGSENVAFIGTGPNSWLAISERDSNNSATTLQRKLEGLASVTDQSDGYAVLRLTGPKVRDMLAKGVPIDLHDRVFGPGMAANTIVSHVGIILWRLPDAGGLAVFEIAVFRSLTSSLWHFLSQSSAEFGLKVMN